jgi:hypothetical protein
MMASKGLITLNKGILKNAFLFGCYFVFFLS